MKTLILGAFKQLIGSWRWLLAIYIPIITLFLGMGVSSKLIPGLSITFFFKDITAMGKLPFYAGFISQLGLFLWSAATTICFFVYYSLKKSRFQRQESLNLLFSAGLLSGYLLIDDAFMLHEDVIPNYLRLVQEKTVMGILGIFILTFFHFNWKEILRSEYSFLFLALAFWGLSAGLDYSSDLINQVFKIYSLEYLAEDGAKFSGIIMWVAFFARYGSQQLTTIIDQDTSESHN